MTTKVSGNGKVVDTLHEKWEMTLGSGLGCWGWEDRWRPPGGRYTPPVTRHALTTTCNLRIIRPDCENYRTHRSTGK